MRNVIILTDGLGNQMFQYALYLAMQAHGKSPWLTTSVISRHVIHNGFELCKDFNIHREQLRIIDRGTFVGGIMLFAIRYVKKLCYIEDEKNFSPTVFTTEKPILFGYWQDIRYFDCVEKLLRETFSFQNIDPLNQQYAEQMNNNNSVSIHIRRGDYLKYPQYQICNEEYYTQAIFKIKEKVQNPVFYIFSDDLQWSEDFMKRQQINYKLIHHNRGQNSYKDMYLMTQCKHNIIANSSFSWWGAWLGEQKGRIVICPDKWNLKSDKIEPQLKHWCKIQTFKNNKI